MNVKVVVCDCGKMYKMSPEMARKFETSKFVVRLDKNKNNTDCYEEDVDEKRRRY